MVKSVSEEYFSKWYSSEVTENGDADSNCTQDLYFSTMKTVLSNTYNSCEDNLSHLKSNKLNIYMEENFEDWCAAILIYADHLERSGDFKSGKLKYITRIFEYNYGYRLNIWVVQKYK